MKVDGWTATIIQNLELTENIDLKNKKDLVDYVYEYFNKKSGNIIKYIIKKNNVYYRINPDFLKSLEFVYPDGISLPFTAPGKNVGNNTLMLSKKEFCSPDFDPKITLNPVGTDEYTTLSINPLKQQKELKCKKYVNGINNKNNPVQKEEVIYKPIFSELNSNNSIVSYEKIDNGVKIHLSDMVMPIFIPLAGKGARVVLKSNINEKASEFIELTINQLCDPAFQLKISVFDTHNQREYEYDINLEKIVNENCSK